MSIEFGYKYTINDFTGEEYYVIWATVEGRNLTYGYTTIANLVKVPFNRLVEDIKRYGAEILYTSTMTQDSKGVFRNSLGFIKCANPTIAQDLIDNYLIPNAVMGKLNMVESRGIKNIESNYVIQRLNMRLIAWKEGGDEEEYYL
jgi:hypothetical protein